MSFKNQLTTEGSAHSLEPRVNQSPTLTKGLTLLLAITTGAAAANFNYAQPLLHALATSFHTTNAKASIIIVCSQGGYAIGLLFLLPLGDLLPRKTLIISSLAVDCVALLTLSFATTALTFAIVSIIVGLSSVVAQIIIPLAADLADPTKTGKAVGTITGGLLVGLLLARAFSGIVADAFGISAVYRIAAIIMLLLTIMMFRYLPDVKPRVSNTQYRSILGSTITLFRQHRLLKIRAVYGGLAFAAFSMFWTSLTFYLSGPTYHYSTTNIGLFGLFGAFGALTAIFTGHAIDKGYVRLTTLLGAVCITLSFLDMHLYGANLALLVIAVIVVDASLQTINTSNQSIIYRITPNARSRINSTYMTSYFIGGSLGSATAGYAWQHGGWATTTTIGIAIGLCISIIWIFDHTSSTIPS